MSLHTCKNGHLTTFRSCPTCKRGDIKEAKRKLAMIRRENLELKRQIRNLTEAIAAGRAL